MKALVFFLCLQTISVFAADNTTDGRKITADTDAKGFTTTMLWQANLDHGVFELKEVGKDG